jgi:leucyl-tRNA synthetase
MPAKRDTDTMDTFVDSSWYFLRFLSPNSTEVAFPVDEAKAWAPVDQYVGGVTHAILHLLYARFVTKVLHDLGYLDFEEPFTRLLNQGMVLMGGSAMSKSRGNLVALSEQLDEHGVDAVRLTMSFAGPPEEDIDWADVSPAGSAKFLARAWRAANDVKSAPGLSPVGGNAELRKATHSFLRDFGPLIENFKFNVGVAKIMELVNALRKAIDGAAGGADPAVREAAETVAKALSLFAPYTAEDMWQKLGHEPGVALAQLAEADLSLLVESSIIAIAQVDGKVRDKFEVPVDITEDALRDLALASDAVKKAIGDKEVANVIVRAPKLVNIATK